MPHIQVAELGPVVDLFAEVGLVASKSAARRTVKEGGAYVNNVKVTAEDAVPAAEDLLHGRWLVLRRGKKNLAAVEVTAADAVRVTRGHCEGRLPCRAGRPRHVVPDPAAAGPAVLLACRIVAM